VSNLRWYVKKAARRAVATGATLPGLGARHSPADPPAIRVLTYHRFGPQERDAFSVTPSAFEDQMAWLAAEGLATSLQAVIDLVHGRSAPRDGSVLVTIDDGCPSVRTHALPILRRHRIPAVVFVPAGEILDHPEPPPAHETDGSRMSWPELTELVDAGIVIGSHAFTHHSLGRMPAEAAREQLERSRALIRERTGQTASAFAYPFGTRADYTPATAALVAAAGYDCAFTSQHGCIRPGADLMELPRLKVEGGEGLEMFRRIVHGGMDGWRFIDRTMWRLKAAR
jgi:peptidoglycan/xylan/chitin deacetylase (PgdA/CDA1 family)